MLSIVYASAASLPFSADDLDALLVQSRATNEQLGLTGLLVHREGHFLQLLEGPDEAVRARMKAIQSDGRHEQVRVLLENEIPARQFPDWSMGYSTTGADDDRVPGYRRSFDDLDANRSTAGSLPALRALIGWYRVQHDI